MLDKLFGEKKSIQRQLVKNVIIVIIAVLVVSVVICYFAVNYEINNKLQDIQSIKEIEIQEMTDILKRNIVIIIFSIFLITGILMGITSEKMLQPIQQITEATKEVASGNFAVELETKR